MSSKTRGLGASESVHRTGIQQLVQRFARNQLAVVGFILVLAISLAAVFAPVLAPHDPLDQNLPLKRSLPGQHFVLGADEFGRDILSRLLFGGRSALLVGVLSFAVAASIGLVLGMVSGVAAGIVDDVIMRLNDIVLAFPYLLLALLIVTALGPSVLSTTIAVGLWGAPSFVRLVRAEVIALRNREFIEAARAVGARSSAIMVRHLLPNFAGSLITFGTLFMARAILVEAALSFLGLGVQPPTPSWGLMVSSGRDFLRVAPHISTLPGIAIMLAVLGFNLLGDGLRDALDPKLRN
ncbi:MAG: ABC transporter permease [Bacillota bacterium]